MSKKKADKMKIQKEIFLHGNGKAEDDPKYVPGALKRGYTEEVALAVFDRMEKFAAYAFNKSHATAYAFVTYQTAYLKTYYALELITAIINNRITDNSQVAKYLGQLKERGVKVLGANINKSIDVYKCEDGNIRFGIAGIKGVGGDVCQKIVNERTENGYFTDFGDFMTRCAPIVRTKSVIEGLIKAGAFDCFGKTRADLLSCYERAYDAAVSLAISRDSDQMSFFDDLPGMNTVNVEYSNLPECPEKEKLKIEKDVCGLYISASPLDDYSAAYQDIEYTIQDIKAAIMPSEDPDMPGAKVSLPDSLIVAGILSKVERLHSKAGNTYVRFVLEDMTDSISGIVFGRTYDNLKDVLVEDNIVKLKVSVDTREETPGINVRGGEIWTPLVAKPQSVAKPRTVYIRFDIMDEEKYEKVKTICVDHLGQCPVRLVVGKAAFDMKVGVYPSEMFKMRIIGVVGEENFAMK